MFKGIKHVRTKILAGFVVLALICLGLGVLSVARMNALNEDTKELYEDDLKAIAAIGEIRVAAHMIGFSLLNSAVNPDPAAHARNEQYIADSIATMNREMAALKETSLAGAEAEMAAVEAALPGWFDTINNTLTPAMRAGDMRTFLTVGSTVLNQFFEIEDHLVKVLANETAHAEALYQNSQQAFESTRTLVIAVALVAMALAVILGLIIARAISRPLGEAADAIDRVAQGDLTVRVDNDRADETGRLTHSLNTMVDEMAATVTAISTAATRLSSASESLTAVSTELSATAGRASTQALSVSSASEEVSANVHTVASGTEEMGASIREIAGNATRAAGVAAEATAVAASTDTSVAKLGESSDRIGQVIGVITSIAEQTNLLALNATIEAARAGEAGKGFAVVAHEVKELAAETSKATGDIRGQVAAIQSDADAVAGAIAQITRVVGEITDFQGTIASAVEEQTVTTNEIARNIADAASGSSDIAANIAAVADASHQTSTGATDILDAATDLSQQADELHGLVTRFRI
jgi:methyl-accepting chemotaxis protein